MEVMPGNGGWKMEGLTGEKQTKGRVLAIPGVSCHGLWMVLSGGDGLVCQIPSILLLGGDVGTR
jgi:hypothetical protein